LTDYDIKYNYTPISIEIEPGSLRPLRSRMRDSDFIGSDWFEPAPPSPAEEYAKRTKDFQDNWFPEDRPAPPFSTAAGLSNVLKEVWTSEAMQERFYAENPFLNMLESQRKLNDIHYQQEVHRQFLFGDQDDLAAYSRSQRRSELRRNQKPVRMGRAKAMKRRTKRWYDDNVRWRLAKEQPYDEDW
jgi:hypothetical protein